MKKILICDDSAYILEVLSAKLEANNYKAVKVSNGKECLKKLELDKPDLLILDIMMPGKDGIEVIKEIREKEKGASNDPKLPIIILSSQNDLTIRLWFENQDIQAYLTKPFEDKDLFCKVKDCLGE